MNKTKIPAIINQMAWPESALVIQYESLAIAAEEKTLSSAKRDIFFITNQNTYHIQWDALFHEDEQPLHFLQQYNCR